jgi:UDP-N-acetylmuramate dehydrogenase
MQSTVRKVYVPRSESELLDTIQALRDSRCPLRVVGKGSNVLVESTLVGALVVNTKACIGLRFCGDSLVEAGSSVMLPRLVSFCSHYGLGGAEYLASIPGTVGGGIAMNAGLGMKSGRSLADHVISVRALVDGKVVTLSKTECQFGYRSSRFITEDSVILSCILTLNHRSKDEIASNIQKRLVHARQVEDHSFPNCGSIYTRNFVYWEQLLGVKLGRVQFSAKTGNWLLNVSGASFDDVMQMFHYVDEIHAWRGHARPTREVQVISWTEINGRDKIKI